MNKKIITTQNAPESIGIYSQAIRTADLVFISGQIPLLPDTMQIISDEFPLQVEQVFRNIRAVCQAAGGDLDNIVKLSIFLTDLSQFETVNEVAAKYFTLPYPARAVVEVSALPRNAQIEAEAIMRLPYPSI